MVESIYFLKPAWCGTHFAGLWPEQGLQPVTRATALRRWFVTVLFIVGAAEKDVFDLKAERVRLGRNQQGSFHIDAQGIAFRAKDGKANVTIALDDLREADLADPRFLRFRTYEIKKWNPTERKELYSVYRRTLLSKTWRDSLLRA